jgi:tRNA modification GTPase
MEDHLKNAYINEIVKNGLQVSIIGEPNAGKSSLLNCLSKRDISIVTEIPGTTRDIVKVQLEIGGQLIILSDTAGIREGTE